MNAKKIMGAVLVALLAAALFVGAGAAAEKDLGTVFESQNVGADFNGNWVNNGKTVVISNGIVGPVAEAGTYKKGDYTVYITKPTASYSLTGTIGGIKYIVANGGNVYLGSNPLSLNIVALNSTVGVSQMMVTTPSGSYLNESKDYFTTASLQKGTYKVQAIFDKGKFVDGVDNALLLDQLNSFSFTVIDDSDATITASVDAVYKGESVKFTITGVPGTKYMLKTEDFNIPANQYVTLETNNVFTMPNNGVAEFAATVTADKKATVVLQYYDKSEQKWLNVDDGKIEITVSKPVITITLGAPAYFIGDEIELTGTSTFEVTSTTYTFNITGVNFASTAFKNVKWDETGKTWTVVLPTAGLTEVETKKTLDVGTYTIEIIDTAGDVIKTATVRLNQPFISIVDAPEVVTQGTDAEFVINAEASPAGIAAYIFGTNFFMNLTDNIDQEDAKKFPTQYTVTIGEKITDNMSTGQYFMVFQHPMYDQEFNIFEDKGEFKLLPNTDLFDVYDRQTANAAQALCDALDSQNIDDMYVKYSFFLVGEDESFTISDIPKEIAKGTTLVISGVDTANAEKEVVVQMLSTAFAAVPKETVGSAAFILVTTEVAEDGTWEVTLDTSDLNVDEYSLSVAIDSVTKKNVNINVIEAADEPVTPPTDEPGQDEPGQDEPVAPETPGFGALAALAGLGAVAVLLLRRE